MGFSTVLSAAVFGLKVELVNVEADVSNGLPMFHMVGYLSSEVKKRQTEYERQFTIQGWNFRQKNNYKPCSGND